MRNGFHIIDSHCHIYPEKIAAKAILGTDNFYGVHSSEHGMGCELIEKSGEYGVDRFVVQSVATTAKQVRSINEFIADEVERSNGRFIGLGTLYPDSPDLTADYYHLKELGLHGVKLHPDIQNFKVDDPKVIEIFKLCNEKNLPVLLHTGDSRYDNSNPDRVEKILKMFPDLTIIGAHFGGWSIWDKAPEILCKYKNFYVDTCSSFYALSRERAREIIELYGADRVIFGTDFPMWRQEDELKFLFSLGLSDRELEMILSKNLEKVLNI